LSICALVAKIQPDKVVGWCPDGDFLHPVFSASHVQHRDIQYPTAEIRGGKKKKERRRNHRAKI